MKRQLAAFALGAILFTVPARASLLTLDGVPLDVGETPVYGNTTFVSLRSFVRALLPDADVRWEEGRAVAESGALTLTIQPGDNALVCSGTRMEMARPARLEAGRTLAPVRSLAGIFGLEVIWNAGTGEVSLSTPEDERDDKLFWLSRIISAESQGERWEGKIAVGNVVLNRVASPGFPNTIYGVIFDDRWGGQFEPARKGTVYREPTQESIRAAAACLAGVKVAGNSLFFLAPSLTDNHWTMENRTWVTTIGAHWFYE